MSDALLTLEEAASRLRVSVRTIEREERDGRITFVRIRSTRLIAASELTRYIAASSCQSAEKVTAGKSGSVLDQAGVLNALSRLLPREQTRGRSKLRSAARRSTLRLVASKTA